MGVDHVLFDRLVELSTRFEPAGRTLMPGRRAFGIRTGYRQMYERTLERHGIDARRFDFVQQVGLAETLMRKPGFGEIETMDSSDRAGAGVIHDRYEVEKTEESHLPVFALQSDRETERAGHENAGDAGLQEVGGAI